MRELIYKDEAVRAVLHSDGQAAVAAVQNIEPTADAVPIDFLKQFADGKRGYYSDFVIEAVKSYRGGA
ncbi:MAG: hypothetical protein IKD54_09720 [Clostridia bacterium]|nr:hypothetical protein [Clostridia bacterium]